jgi:nucleoside-diphosphate-sugar epimerase
MSTRSNQVLVTGGETFLGVNIIAALLAEGAEVTALIRPQAEEKLGVLLNRVRWYSADVWNEASLRGRARGHNAVIHTVGSMIASPEQGLTFQRLNLVSARNVANMCVSDGVSHLVLMSGIGAPWMNPQYIGTKRDAEAYVKRVGLQGSFIRAPLVYIRGTSRPLFYRFLSLLGNVPPISWMGMNKVAPMPLDIVARGVARIALLPYAKPLYHAPDLRRLNRADELRGVANPLPSPLNESVAIPHSLPFDAIEDDAPFGWN